MDSLNNKQIVTVTSDHADPATLDTTKPSGAGSQLPISVFSLNGYADMDPLSINRGNAPVNEHTALQIPAYYSGCLFISQTIGGLPKHVFKRTGGTAPQRLYDHPAEWTLNSEPNNLQTPSTFFSTFLLHAVNWSNGYAAYKADAEDPQLFNLPPDRVTAFRFKGNQYYAYDTETPTDPANPNSRYIIFSAEEIIHLPALSFDGMAGLPMVKLMSGTLRTNKNTEAYVSNYYGQGGILMGFLSSDKPLTKEQVNEYVDIITNKFSGVEKAHKWMVVGDGMKAQNLTSALDTAATTENRTWNLLDICRMLRLPPHCLYELGKATWANIESMGIELVRYTFINWIRPLEQELTRKLLTRQERKAGCYIKFDVSELLRGDNAAQIAAAVSRTQNGLTDIDQERAVWDMPPYADGIGSHPRVQINTIALTDALAPAAAPSAGDTGDLAKINNAEAYAVKKHLKLSHFSAMIQGEAQMVHRKTDKATEAALKKHADNATDFTAWAARFSNDQKHFAAAAMQPVFQTYVNLSGQNCDGKADYCGTQYGAELLEHLDKLVNKSESVPPDLAQIVLDTEGDNGPETESTKD